MLAGVGPASDGKTLFTGPAGPGGWFGGERSHLSGDGGAVWRKCGQCGEVVAALARERQCGGQANGWAPAAAAQARTRVAVGADRREAGPDLAGGGGRVGRGRHAGELRRGNLLPAAHTAPPASPGCGRAPRSFNEAPARSPGKRARLRRSLRNAIVCFNEAPACSPGKPWRHLTHHPRRPASMRPRPAHRGNWTRRLTTSAAFSASMRPRPAHRGNSQASRCIRKHASLQ